MDRNAWSKIKDPSIMLRVLGKSEWRRLLWHAVHVIIREVAPYVEDEYLTLAAWVVDATQRRASANINYCELQAVREAVVEAVVMHGVSPEIDVETVDLNATIDLRTRPKHWPLACFEYALFIRALPSGSLAYLAACILSENSNEAYAILDTDYDYREAEALICDKIREDIPVDPAKTKYVFFEDRPVCPETLFSLPPDMLPRWDAACERGEVHF